MILDKIYRWVTDAWHRSEEKKDVYDRLYSPQLKSDTSDKGSMLIYIGCNGDEYLISIIQKNIPALYTHFTNNQSEFIFYPDLQMDSVDIRNVMSLSPIFSYYFPIYYGREAKIEKELRAIGAVEFYRSICLAYGVDYNFPPFILLIENAVSSKPKLKTFPISLNGEKILTTVVADIQKYLDPPKSLYEGLQSHDLSYYDPSQFEREGSLWRRENKPYDADEVFESEASQLSDMVILQINALKENGQRKALLSIYNMLITQARLLKPAILKELGEIELTQSKMPLSRLVVDKHYRISLPDYDNLEIEMTPLPKTLYLFFLKHPEGIMLHNLVDHKNELLSIYSRITNSSNTFEIRKRIHDMTDIRKNSLNEKCSRIKEAFVIKMDDAIARNYYISGGRGEVKRILLNSSLVNSQS